MFKQIVRLTKENKKFYFNHLNFTKKVQINKAFYTLNFIQLIKKRHLLINNFSRSKNYLLKDDVFLSDFTISGKTQDIIGGLKKINNLLEILNETTSIDTINIQTNLSFNILKKTFNITNYNLNEQKKNKNQVLKKNLNFFLNEISPQIISILFFNYHILKYNLLKSLFLSIVKLEYLFSNSLRSIYLEQGISIDSLHFEIIIKKFCSKLKIIAPNDTLFLINEILDISLYRIIYNSYYFSKEIVPFVEPVLFGLSKISLKQTAILSNISFQETTNNIIKYSLINKKDWLDSIKSSLIVGKTTNVGTALFNKI